MAAGGLDWARLERDFPGANVVVQLSRPGCDSQGVFAIVQARYRHRNERLPDEGVLFQLAKQPDGTWKWERSAVAHAEHLAQ
jgi:hypothetical protein